MSKTGLTQERWLDENEMVIYTADFSYDAASNLTGASDAVSAYALSYDALGRRTQVDNFGTADMPHVILDSAYDAMGNRTSLSATIDGVADFVNNYQYDALSRMTRIEQVGQASSLPVSDKRVDFTYTATGQFDTITRYADLAGTALVATSTYSYDSKGLLQSLTHSTLNSQPSTLASYTWTHDALGRITSATSIDGTSNYTYDDTSQLTGATHDYQSDENYSYDANGNRTTSGYVTGANNQLLSDGTYDYEYDSEGNRTKKTNIATGEVIEYEWDHHNRLTRITEKSSDQGPVTSDVSYTYDVFGHRIAKDIDNDGDGTLDAEHKYIYDGLRPERGNAGDHIVLAFNGNDELTNRYLHGAAVDQILADEQLIDEMFDQVLWPLTDNLGSLRDLAEYDSETDTTEVVNHIVYDSFGKITSETDAARDLIFGFTGRERDEESHLQYNRARYYDPAIGQWVSADPIGFQARDANLRRYVSNGATNLLDPSGLSKKGLLKLFRGVVFDKDTNEVVLESGKRIKMRNNKFIGSEVSLDDLAELTSVSKTRLTACAKNTPI